MKNVSLLDKVWTIVSQSFTLPLVLMARLITKLINRVSSHSKSLTPQDMANDVTVGKVRRKLIVGLGNPGMTGTRHSVGMAVLAALADRLGVPDRWRTDRHVLGEVIVSEFQDSQLVLLRPRLLMNINGLSVAKAVRKFSVKPEHIVLVHDELDKPFGKFNIKHGGSARGHNGVRSCVECLQTDVMPRLWIGIGRPQTKSSVNHHVLGRFSPEEQKVLSSVLEQSVETLLTYISDVQPQKGPPGGRRGARNSTPSASPSPCLDSDKDQAQT